MKKLQIRESPQRFPEMSDHHMDDVKWLASTKSEIPLAEHGKFKTGVPVSLRYAHNTEKAPKVDWAGQEVEPTGFYCIEVETDKLPDTWVSGEVELKNPLVIPFGGTYREPSNWKRVLAQHFNKTGKRLSQALLLEGYDAVVTVNKYGTSEIVLLKKT